MTRSLLLTADGSHTIALEPGSDTFHSRHGAIGESQHVYIKEGWKQVPKTAGQSIAVLEMGLGTGLNALLTLQESQTEGVSVRYEALELYPLEAELYTALNYCDCLQQPDLKPVFEAIHTAAWNEPVMLQKGFELLKRKVALADFHPQQSYHLIYYDAFSPNSQGELWTTLQFQKLYNALNPGGLLVTYCSKAVVRRAMVAAGFRVEKPQGPWGKREMVRAIRID